MPIWPFQVSGPAQGEVPPFVPQPSSTRQVSSTGLSRRCCLRASPDRPTRLRLAVPKWTRRQGEETPLGPSSGEETPISQDGMSYRVRSLPSSLFHPSNRALPSDCVARVEKLTLDTLTQVFHPVNSMCQFGHFKSPVLHKVRCLPSCHSLVALGR